MAGKKKLSGRALRREAERAAEKLGRDREKLASLEPGGAPERPIEIRSASEVEVIARSMPCSRCGAPVRLDEHLADTIGITRFRIARLSCSMCGARRSVYFRIALALPN